MTINNILNNSLETAQILIADFLNSDNITESLTTAFGTGLAVDLGISLLESMSQENITIPIGVVSSAEINNARGAYSTDNNTIYLATELLDRGDVDATTKVLLEEIGHYIDSQVNSSDAAGDEGAIFASFVLGEELNETQLELLKAKNDTVTVELDGENITLEQDTNIFVDAEASGSNDGSSWENAYTNLQDALNSAVAGDLVWVANGTYLPTTTENRETSFVIPSNVKVYGGFAGGETELDARDPQNNVTTLSGDIGTSDDISDNSYSVVTLENVEGETLLDGFTITEGNASDLSSEKANVGGGIFALDSAATLNNLVITENKAQDDGGGIYSEDSQLEIANTEFIGNIAGVNEVSVVSEGGGLFANGGTTNLDDVAFIDNFAFGNGGGIAEVSNVINLNNARFIGNYSGGFGGGIHAISGGIESLSNSLFLNNSAVSRGGGIDLAGASKVSNTIFKSNTAGIGGGINNLGADVRITNSLYEDNFAVEGAGIYNGVSSPEIINSTFTNNFAQRGSGVASSGFEGDRTAITNSIFWDNFTATTNSPISNSDSETEVNFSIVQGGYDGTSNINAEPQFVAPNSFDYRLNAGSPALDGGNNEVVSSEDTDLADNPRIASDTVDLGAYEGAALDPVPTEPQLTDETPIIFVDAEATEGENNGTSWDNAYTDFKTALSNAPFGSQIWVAEGTYTPSDSDREISFELPNGVGIYGGFSGGETSLDERNIAENTTILSGEIGDTSVNSDNSYNVVLARNVTNSTILDGFTISGGNANGDDERAFGGAISNSGSSALYSNLRIENNRSDERGGSVYVNRDSSNIFTNVDFTNNTTTGQGGAVYNHFGHLVIQGGTFSNNSATASGGAIYSLDGYAYVEGAVFDSNSAGNSGGAVFLSKDSNPDLNFPNKRITNSIFTNNSAEDSGGGLTVIGAVEGVNLTFVKNQSPEGAAVGHVDSLFGYDNTSAFYNNIFWDNTGAESQIFNQADSAVVRNSIVEGGYEGGENIIDSDPQFVDRATENLRIGSDSPAVNAGLNTVVTEDDDVANRPRINQETVDIGAYEFTEGDNDSGTGGGDGDGDGDGDSDGDNATIELFRFRNVTFDSGTYVFVDATERDAILANPDFNQTFELEGDGNAAFKASTELGDNLIPFYRLASLDILGTFLFVSTGEYDAIFAEDSAQRDKWDKQGLDAEGEDIPEFYLLDGSADTGVEFNRFQNTQNGTFLYAGPEETTAIDGDPNLSSLFNNQGVAFESLT